MAKEAKEKIVIPAHPLVEKMPEDNDRKIDFMRRTWTAAFIIGLVLGGLLLLCVAYRVILLFLAAVLVAIFLRAISDCIRRFVHVGEGWALGMAIVLVLCVGGGISWLLETQISSQANQISQEVPQAITNLDNQLRHYSWGTALVNQLQSPHGAITQTGAIVKKAQDFLFVSLNGIVDFLVIVASGFYLACRPKFYFDGFLRLLPFARRHRFRMLFIEVGRNLRQWLFGQMVAMMIVGTFTWLGLLLLGIPGAGVLGVLAGLLDFVPIAGTFISGLAACMIALVKSPIYAFYVVCLFTALHLLEVNVIVPMVQNRATHMPPALIILGMVLFYTLFGFFGLLLAVPLLALAIITIRTLYIEDVIEHPPSSV